MGIWPGSLTAAPRPCPALFPLQCFCRRQSQLLLQSTPWSLTLASGSSLTPVPVHPPHPLAWRSQVLSSNYFHPNSPFSLEIPDAFPLSPRDQWVVNCRACGSVPAHNLALCAKSAFDICKEKRKGVWDRDVSHSLKCMKYFPVGLCPLNAWCSLFSGLSFSGALPAFKHQE